MHGPQVWLVNSRIFCSLPPGLETPLLLDCDVAEPPAEDDIVVEDEEEPEEALLVEGAWAKNFGTPLFISEL